MHQYIFLYERLLIGLAQMGYLNTPIPLGYLAVDGTQINEPMLRFHLVHYTQSYEISFGTVN